MSRIAGLILTRGDLWSKELSAKMAARLCQSDWTTNYSALERACFLWCGWREPQIVEIQETLVVLDGFIYNRRELGGIENDAKLIATRYQKYGFDETLKRINGDFTVALFDNSTGEIWLARDRFGIKPLYYVSKPEFFAFASRPSALLTLPDVSKEVNRQFVALFAASHYRYFDNNPETSPYADITQLPAANILCLKNNHITKTRYWSLQDLPDFTESERELAACYCEFLKDAVSLRVKAAQRPAFTLSGGMDSSSVLASAVQVTGAKQHAFSTVYVDQTYDESEEIRAMLDTKVEQWHSLEIGIPNVFDLVKRMIEVHDEPVATATWLSHFLLCEETVKQGFGGLFGGLGGDELNAGEYEYFFYHFADLRASGFEEQLRREVEMWIRYHNHPIFQKSFDVMQEGLARLVDFANPGKCLPDRRRIERYFSTLNREYFDLQAFEPIMDHPFSSYLKNRTYQDLFRETIPCCLRAEDRQTTAFELDNFLPFLDYRLVEFMFRISGNLKIREGITKYLLREAMHGILPEETHTRVKKTGWNAPAHIWFSGKGQEQLMDMVRSQSFRERGIYNLLEVERFIEEHEEIVSSSQAKENHMMFLWQLVNLELWLLTLKEI